MLIAVEGIDGSGKGTQSQLLVDRLKKDGITTGFLSFPQYESTEFGRRIGDFLNGRFGDLDQVSPFLASLLYAGDRFESRERLKELLDANDIVVLDRYVPSNVAHQGAKVSGDERQEIINWIHHVEYTLFQLPTPDLVILLDLPADQAQQLIQKKQQRTYTDKAADLQEADGDYLAQVRQVYVDLAAQNDRWQTINCLSADGIRPIEDIADEIYSVVRSKIKN